METQNEKDLYRIRARERRSMDALLSARNGGQAGWALACTDFNEQLLLPPT